VGLPFLRTSPDHSKSEFGCFFDRVVCAAVVVHYDFIEWPRLSIDVAFQLIDITGRVEQWHQQ
jgi:hypothetical protein